MEREQAQEYPQLLDSWLTARSESVPVAANEKSNRDLNRFQRDSIP